MLNLISQDRAILYLLQDSRKEVRALVCHIRSPEYQVRELDPFHLKLMILQRKCGQNPVDTLLNILKPGSSYVKT